MAPSGTDGHNPGSRVAAPSDSESNGPPTLRGEEESFFRAGDEGRYEGGPATVISDEVELDAPAVRVIIRTPEMDARRARYVRLVSASLGALTALFAIGLVRRTEVADSSSHRESVGILVASPAAHAPESDPIPAKPAPAPAVVEAPKPAKSSVVEKIQPLAAAALTKTAKVSPHVPIAPAAPIHRSVANFAAKPAAPTPPPAKPSTGSLPPTAAFPVPR